MLKNLKEILNSPSASKKKYAKSNSKNFSPDILDFFQLVQSWEKIVGKPLAQNSQPLKIQNNTLFVLVKHSVFAQELNFLTEQIKKSIIEVFPSLRSFITQIKFLSSPQFFQHKEISRTEEIKAKTTHRHPQSPYYLQQKADAEKVFAEVTDAETKEILVSLYLQTLETK